MDKTMKRCSLVVALLLLSAALVLSPVFAQEPVTIRVMTQSLELSPEQIAAFEAANPDINVELIEIDQLVVDMSIASGDVPDLLRMYASTVPSYVQQGLLLDLTPYFEASSIITLDDIAPAADYYQINDRYYGLPKDWSLDFSLYIYTPTFETAGVPIPSTSEPLTYAELADIARQLREGGGDTMTSYALFIPRYERVITAIMLQYGTSLFSADFSEMRLTDNPRALEVIRFFYDLTLEGVMNPNTGVPAWGTDTMPIFQWGYWYGGAISDTNPMYGQLMMLPAPTWDRRLPRLNTTVGPVGMTIMAGSRHPDEAYRFFEWYIVGEEGRNRTRHGWGAPPLLSMFDLLPQDTDFNRQRYEVLVSELPYADWVLPVYPYQSIGVTFDESWEINMARALRGEIDFETFVSNLQEAVNLAILNEQLTTG